MTAYLKIEENTRRLAALVAPETRGQALPTPEILRAN